MSSVIIAILIAGGWVWVSWPTLDAESGPPWPVVLTMGIVMAVFIWWRSNALRRARESGAGIGRVLVSGAWQGAVFGGGFGLTFYVVSSITDGVPFVDLFVILVVGFWALVGALVMLLVALVQGASVQK